MSLTVVAAVHPHTVAVISTPALHDVVGVVGLRHFVVWINLNLEEEERNVNVQQQIRET